MYHVTLDRSTHERLRNWARVQRNDGPSPGHCCSVEHRYNRQDDPDVPTALPPPRRPVVLDFEDAEKVDRVLRGQTFPAREHAIIVAHYLLEQRHEKTCRQLGIRFKAYDEHVARAVLMVRNRLADWRDS